jgi:phospholipase/carboxylesterase
MPWGYGPGWAWYRFLGGDAPEPESFAASQAALGELLAALPAELPVRPGPLVLGGFSQGGTMSVAYALRNPGTVPRVLCFSGFLPSHPTVAATAETVRGTRFWWGHGTLDESIPWAWGDRSRKALLAAGANLTVRDYRIAHGISPDEIRDARGWLEDGSEGAG